MTSAADLLQALLATTARGISFSEACERILATAPAPVQEDVALETALGRTLAAPLRAARDNPAAHVSAMDGYALRHGDLGDGDLILEGENAAGSGPGDALNPGTARRIFTGAPLPPGADTVVMQEEVSLKGASLTLSATPALGDFVRPQGFDFAFGETLLAAGEVLSDRALAVAAAANLNRVSVARPPRVALLSTGDELKAPGKAVQPQDVVASNALALSALLTSAGAEVQNLGYVGDQEREIAQAVGQAGDADLLLTTGGASVGAYDLVQRALAGLGGTPHFWQVMMRPGKPVFLWRLGSLTVLGLPGNPVSAYVCARLLALPWVRKALGREDWEEPRQTFTLAAPLPANGPRHQFARADLQGARLFPAPSQDSSLLRTLHRAGALIERPPHDPLKTEGEQVSAVVL